MSELPPAAGYAFSPLDGGAFELYCAWYASDPERRWVSAPTPQWFDYLQHTPGAHGWLVRAAEGQPVGVVQLDEEADRRGGLMLYVAPEARRRGHGRGILREVIALAELAHLRTFAAHIEPENIASLRCCLAAGFVPTSPEPDADGLLSFEYHR